MEDTNRKLASIQKIKAIENIEGKDKIGYISFEGVNWSVIGNKNLSIGELVCFVEYDSILPELPCFEFLRKRCYSQKRRGFVIRPMKMAQKVSYGILFDKNDLKDIFTEEEWNKLKEGDDITDALSIRKMEDDVPNEAHLFQNKTWFQKIYDKIIYKLFHIKTKGSNGWPGWASKSDETRIEAFGADIFKNYEDLPVYSTVKIDGQSSLFGIYKNVFYVGSRNCLVYKKDISKAVKELNLKNIEKNRKFLPSYCVSASIYELPKKMREVRKQLGYDFYIQCEQAGPAIQGNKLGLKDLVLYMFNFVKIENKSFYSWKKIKKIAECLNIPTVPLIDIMPWRFNNLQEAKEYAKGNYENGHVREGVVIRAMIMEEDEPMPQPEKGMSNQWSLKIINDDFIL